jgi:hypothetical protein
VISAEPVLELAVAETVTMPDFFAVTTPLELTVATLLPDDVQVKVTFGTVRP